MEAEGDRELGEGLEDDLGWGGRMRTWGWQGGGGGVEDLKKKGIEDFKSHITLCGTSAGPCYYAVKGHSEKTP